MKEGVRLAKDGEIEEAIAAYQEAQKLDPTLEISADSWGSLCFFGSLKGHAADVMFACEKAVALEPEPGRFRGSHGIARALTGDIEGAIEDFYASMNWSNSNQARAKYKKRWLDQWRARLKPWIDSLRAGKNPFTPEEIERLLNE